MEPKSIFASKTIIFNGIVVIVAALVGIQNVEFIASNPQLVAWITAAIGVLNSLLRVFTTKPVTVLPK